MVSKFHSCEKSILRKNPAPLIEKCPSLVLSRNARMLHHLFRFLVYYPSNGRLWEAKNKRKVKFFALKVVAVAYERWPRTWNSKYNEFTLKRLVFWETGCWEEVVANICLTAFPLLAGQHYKRKAREPCQKITWKGLGIKLVKGLTLLSFILSWCLGWDTFFYLRLWRDFIRMESYKKY